jgi:hypothetical protein
MLFLCANQKMSNFHDVMPPQFTSSIVESSQKPKGDDRNQPMSSSTDIHRHRFPKQPNNIRLLACAFVASSTTGGVVYSFGFFGGELKSNFHLTQSQLDTISAANFCAGLLSWIPGLMIDHWGVRTSLFLGGTGGAFFMTIYWAVARQLLVIDNPNILLPLLCFLGLFVFMTNSLVTGSIFKLLVATCAPNTKGSIVGAAKGYVGLGSGVYACLFRALKTPNIRDIDFMLMSAILAFLTAALPAIVLLPSNLETLLLIKPGDLDQTTSLHLRCLYGGLVLLASIVVGTTIASLSQDDYDSSTYKTEMSYNAQAEPIPTNPHLGRATLICLAWMMPIFVFLTIPTKSKFIHESMLDDEDSRLLEQAGNKQEEEDDIGDFKPLVKTHSSPALAYGAEIADSVHVPRGLLGKIAIHASYNTVSAEAEVMDHLERQEYALKEMLQTTPAWLFAWITVIRVGSGTMVTNNMGQMVESLKLPKHTTTPAALALFSVAQAASRVMTGAVSDWALSWDWFHKVFFYHPSSSRSLGNGTRLKLHGIPRPVFLLVASFAGTFAHIFMSLTTTRNWFLVGVCFSGAAFGMIWPLMVLIVGEVFGARSMGQNYMFYDGLAGALGTLLLSKFLTQEVYEEHIASSSNSPGSGALDERTCFGRKCFFASHIIIATLSFTCIQASYCFYRMTRHIYATKVNESLGWPPNFETLHNALKP